MAITLISCDSCAVVLDESKLNYADDKHIFLSNGTLDEDRAVIVDGEYVPYVRCPVCDDKILKGQT